MNRVGFTQYAFSTSCFLILGVLPTMAFSWKYYFHQIITCVGDTPQNNHVNKCIVKLVYKSNY